MNTIQRYQYLRNQFAQKWPADRDGLHMNLQHLDLGDGTSISAVGSRIDSDPTTVDLINVTSDGYKGTYRYESFLQRPEQGFWSSLFGQEPEQHLYYLSRIMSHTGSGYHLADVVLQDLDLNTGKLLSERRGAQAIEAGRVLEDETSTRLYLEPSSIS